MSGRFGLAAGRHCSSGSWWIAVHDIPIPTPKSIHPQLAVYTTYIPLIVLAFWGVICYLPPFRGIRNNHWQKNPHETWKPEMKTKVQILTDGDVTFDKTQLDFSGCLVSVGHLHGRALVGSCWSSGTQLCYFWQDWVRESGFAPSHDTRFRCQELNSRKLWALNSLKKNCAMLSWPWLHRI